MKISVILPAFHKNEVDLTTACSNLFFSEQDLLNKFLWGTARVQAIFNRHTSRAKASHILFFCHLS